MSRPHVPVVLSRCADCGVGTDTIREYYMVHDRIWEQAWAGRRKPQILCIGCLEARLGRRLTRIDFTNVPINDPGQALMSARLRERLKRRPRRG